MKLSRNKPFLHRLGRIFLSLFPTRSDKAFRSAIVPILDAYEQYFAVIIDFLFEKNEKKLEERRIIVETQIQQLPTWVYRRGFDAGLKEGYQYFLMKMQHVARILFAMNHVARMSYDNELLAPLREQVIVCAERMRALFKALITVFELKKLTEGIEDLEFELSELDKKFQTMIPVSVELIDMSPVDASFYAFIYLLVDLRKALNKLAQTLR